MPGKQKMIKEARESLRLLRRVGKECIDQRREAIQSGKEDTLDILTQILKGDGRKLIALWVNLSVACFSRDLGRNILGNWTLGLSPPLMTSEMCFFTLRNRTRTCFENSMFLDVGSSTGLGPHRVVLSAFPPCFTSEKMLEAEQSALTLPAGVQGHFLISFIFLSWQLWRKLEMMKTCWITLSLSLLRVSSYSNICICNVGSCAQSWAAYESFAHSLRCCCDQESLCWKIASLYLCKTSWAKSGKNSSFSHRQIKFYPCSVISA